ncbi:DUF6328 family protein [Piscinibacter koreensis]|uniref:Sodium:proton antiporter n=1 Tax=Piscinibacter koreensis TaxID=2742824 RepID=A0A7Y6TYN6_9BURK|nr:DUF6328 family protein [Schlegelella koreensis]NUZ08404.1 hypothetical protein [Schlegelella koreensis]
MSQPDNSGAQPDNELGDVLAELRVVLPGAQLLSGFLLTLPFSTGFAKIVDFEKVIFVFSFVSSLISLILFTAPAYQHRLMRPLTDRGRFKDLISRQMLVGSVFLASALILSCWLVLSEIVGARSGLVVAAACMAVLGALWWLAPLLLRRRWSAASARNGVEATPRGEVSSRATNPRFD